MTALLLAAIEVTQGICMAAYHGLEVVKRQVTTTRRKQEQAKKMQASVQRDLDSIPVR